MPQRHAFSRAQGLPFKAQGLQLLGFSARARSTIARSIRGALVAAVVLGILASAALQAAAQEPRPTGKLAKSQEMADEALAAKEPETPKKSADARAAYLTDIPEMNLWEMTVAGGPLMVPIGLFSILVVALGFERAIALRRRNILPRRLIQGLKSLSHQDRGIDPRQAHRVCQKHPSSAASVIRALLLKLGRPHSEVREAIREASQREVDRLTAPVRWLTLSAAVAPMLGLLGTVQGMIMAFFITAHLGPGAPKAQFLAQSIYIALVTTFAGLTVAIPAAVLAHLFNGRVLKLFRQMDEVLLVLESQIRRYRRWHRRSGGEVPPVGSSPQEGVLPLPPEEPRAGPVASKRK